MAKSRSLNLFQVQHLIVSKPLAIVSLRHSDRNKKLITKALKNIHQQGNGEETLKTLHQFLDKVATRYPLQPEEHGVRRFLLREIESILNSSEKSGSGTAKKVGLIAGLFRVVVG